MAFHDPLRGEAHVSQELEPTVFVIDASHALPLYHQIKENILDLIEGDVLRVGQMIPSERELAGFYGVNRLTVRHAINDLVRSGALRRQRGVGTFVMASQFVQFYSEPLGFSARMLAMGLKPSSRIVSLQVVPAPMWVAPQLGLEPDATVFKLVRLRLADGEPVMFETSFLSQESFPGLMSVDFSRVSLYATLAERYGCRVVESEDTFEPVLLSDHEAEMLGADADRPAMLLESLSFDEHGRPVNVSRSVARGDKSRFCLRIRRRA